MDRIKNSIDRVKRKFSRSSNNNSGSVIQSNGFDADTSPGNQARTETSPAPPKSKAPENHRAILVESPHDIPLEHDENSSRSVVNGDASYTTARQTYPYIQAEFEHGAPSPVIMSRVSTWNTPYDIFEEKIMKEMAQFKIGLNSGKMFLPDDSIKNLVTPENIISIWENIDRHLVSFIVIKAPKTFVITVRAMPDQERALLAMEAFKRHDFTDRECLPVENLLLNLDPDRKPCARFWG